VLRIGLTGGIGSGKSTVAARLVALGAALVDTDRLAREATLAGGVAIEPIRAAFGPASIGADGALDRAWMRERAFADSDARRRLEAILHPTIGAAADAQAAAATGVAIVFDVPLLVESGRWRRRVDRVWVVDCEEATQVARVVARSGWTEDAVRRVVAQQATRAQRRAAADAVLHNDGIDVATLERGVDALWKNALAASAAPPVPS
jgi:dephospho-CoA kinase